MTQDTQGYVGVEPDAIRALRRVRVFADLAPEELALLARRAHRRRVPRGAMIMHQDDMGTAAYFIVAGGADVLLESEDGRQFIVAQLGPGDHVGEMSLLDGEPRSATVVASADADLLVLQREEFLQEIAQHPRLMREMLTALSRRLRVADAQVAALAFGDTAARLARLLLQNGKPITNGGLVVHAVQEQLAAMAGTTRQTVGRIFGEWRRAGYIRTGRSSTVVLRPDALRQIIP
ncbi:MAG: Crp/Fnr family transcriptional regulator [Dehalococcoidia bacterium]